MKVIEFSTKRKKTWMFTDTKDSTILEYLLSNCPVFFKYREMENADTKEKMLEIKFKIKHEEAFTESLKLAHNKVLLTGYHTYDKDNEKIIKMAVKEEYFNDYVREVG
jgi:hypothetical protein